MMSLGRSRQKDGRVFFFFFLQTDLKKSWGGSAIEGLQPGGWKNDRWRDRIKRRGEGAFVFGMQLVVFKVGKTNARHFQGL